MCTSRLLVVICAAALLAIPAAVTGSKRRSYDYVIVGGGTAGCVLAARLSEDCHRSVLLLEAGGEEEGHPEIQIPGKRPKSICSPFIWGRLSTPQKWCCSSYVDRRLPVLTGKVLGGGSSINGMTHIRGSKHDFDEWARRGCDGWSYKDVLPYFIKSETFKGTGDAGYHGYDGPIVVTDLKGTPLSEVIFKAGANLGYKFVDVNGKEQLGVTYSQTTTFKGYRWSAAMGYLRPARGRKNLHVITKAHVTKLLFRGKHVVGVEYVRNNKRHRARAKKEVILSAGVIGTPHILLLSGVGPKNHLKKKRVPVVVDLPVGNNLHDHFKVVIEYSTTVDISFSDDEANSPDSIPINGFTEGIAFGRSKHQPWHESYPYLMLLFKGTPKKSKTTGTDVHVSDAKTSGNNATCKKGNMQDEVFDALHNKTGKINGFKVVVINLHPGCTGTVRLDNTNPFKPPLINTMYLRNKGDVDVIVEGIRKAQEFVSTNSFKSLGSTLLARQHPDCTRHDYDSDAYWRCHIKRAFAPNQHNVGTCKMGSWCDPTAVVDSQLRVFGLTGVRVVDASVMPLHVSGSPNAAVLMIAEKAADMIRAEHECYE